METTNFREIFRDAGKSIDMDREIGTFDQPEAKEVSWLMSDPQTAEEIAENIYERLRALGIIGYEHDKDDVDGVALMGAYLARKRAQGENSL